LSARKEGKLNKKEKRKKKKALREGKYRESFSYSTLIRVFLPLSLTGGTCVYEKI
jgi:hypothetical protein